MEKLYQEISDIETNEIESKIIDAFMTLYAENSIEKISIQQITDLAHLHRGTFYLHYLDIYDLLKKIESRYYTVCKNIAKSSVEALWGNTNLEEVLPSMKFY